MELYFCINDKIEIGKLNLLRDVDYIATEGSTIITFTDKGIVKLNTLENGNHEIKILYTNDKKVIGNITIEKEDLSNTILLKLGAVDSSCSIYVNGKHVKDHDGGYSQIDADITDYLTVGENRIVVKAVDNRYTDKPRGKQYWKDKPDRCWYTETSGIHRTCFLEFAGKTYIEYFRILPDIDTNTISLDMSLSKPITGKLEVEISYKNNLVKDYVVSLNDDHYVKETLTIKPEDDIDETTYWSIDNPNLYDIKFYLFDHNKLVDKVSSYFGLRKIEIKDNEDGVRDAHLKSLKVLMKEFIDTMWSEDRTKANTWRILGELVRGNEKLSDVYEGYNLEDVLSDYQM